LAAIRGCAPIISFKAFTIVGGSELIRVTVLITMEESTGRWGYHEVLERTVHPVDGVVALVVGPEDGPYETIEATAEHPFWAREGWTPAGELRPGDELFTSTGGWIRVHGNTWIAREQLVYNLDVDGADTFFVGESGAWVHNTCQLNARQRFLLTELRAGRDVGGSIGDARAVAAASGLSPWTSHRFNPTSPAPRGTYRGDLLNTRNPTAPHVHPEGTAPPTHTGSAHYNFYFWDGARGTFIIDP
jgi:hypothetical protein